MAAQVKVRERTGSGLLRPRQNAGPVCDERAAESSKCSTSILGFFNYQYQYKFAPNYCNKMGATWDRV